MEHCKHVLIPNTSINCTQTAQEIALPFDASEILRLRKCSRAHTSAMLSDLLVPQQLHLGQGSWLVCRKDLQNRQGWRGWLLTASMWTPETVGDVGGENVALYELLPKGWNLTVIQSHIWTEMDWVVTNNLGYGLDAVFPPDLSASILPQCRGRCLAGLGIC